MLKTYRRRFVLLNLILVGAVLLGALVAQGVRDYRTNYDELQTTLALIVRPWDEPGKDFRAAPPDGERPPMPKEDLREAENGFITVFYDAERGFSLLSRDAQADSAVLDAAKELLAQPDGFGRSGSLYYYKESVGENCKLAFAPAAYLTEKTVRTALILSAVYVLAMALVLAISVRLSHLAAKPMEDAIARERQFVADLSHDLKTPITVILANNSILRSKQDAPSAEREPWLDSTDEAAKSMMAMAEQMLTLSALEAPQTAPKETVSLSDAAEKAALQLEPVAFERGVSVESEIERGVNVLGSADLALLICTGLLENAIKYEPSGGTVRLTLQKGRQAILTVQNGGSVIDKDDLPHVFERFYRGDKARDTRKGHGLGLPIVKKQVELLGGGITAESDAESGTVFTVTLPITE
ncbi:MAG: HAMP domain-containing histidine kinase [Oscillospiraceae bacterium]|nr:HAMP domain-containing histidine kinase [Oscillospiraceae bacterium]